MRSLNTFLTGIISNLKNNYGKEFFNSLTIQLGFVINADITFIAKVDLESSTAETVSLESKGGILENFSYSLKGTPCADVSNNKICSVKENVTSLYPTDIMLKDMGIEAYIGSPLYDSEGAVIGILVALFKNKITSSEITLSLFELFSGRISAEIERERKNEELEILNKQLEKKVDERSKELSLALGELFEKERMASVGRLVGGVAHEINTPLSVAITAASLIDKSLKNIDSDLSDDSLSKELLTKNLSDIKGAEYLLNTNLSKVASLVSEFKKLAFHKNEGIISSINLTTWLVKYTSSMKAIMKEEGIKLELKTHGETIVVNNYMGKLAQVIGNLVSNSINHAFETKDQNNKISIEVSRVEENCVISISDNGKGIPPNVQRTIFDAFYTTKRNCGSIGLGLCIVVNAVKEAMKGEFYLESNTGKGTCFKIEIPDLRS